MKVFLDSNIYISALLFGGKPRRVFDLARLRAFDLVISTAVLEELRQVLSKKFSLGYDEVDFFIDTIERTASEIKTTKAKKATDRAIYLDARALKTDYLITGNVKDFSFGKARSRSADKKPRITTPDDFLKLIGEYESEIS